MNTVTQPTQTTDTGFDYHSIPPGYYDEIFHRNRGIQSKWHHVKFLGVKKALQSLGTGRVLDIGCGPGTFAGVLSDFDYLGVDLSSLQIDYARQHYGDARHRFEVSKVGTLACGDNAVEFVTSVEVIEHITQEEGASMLREAMRCLRPGGWVVMTTPNYLSHWPILEYLVSKLSPMDYVDQHISHYNAGTLGGLLRETGFINVNVRSFVHTAPFLAAFSWRLADWAFAVEYMLLRRLGATLLATAQKPK